MDDTTTGPIVQTAVGAVRGSIEDGVVAFRGIPYGASTAGAGRFRPPGAVVPWAGVRDAVEYGDRSPQTRRPPGRTSRYIPDYRREPARRMVASEDCLVVNVWTPGLDAAARRPVMLWIHGGGYSRGSGSSAWTNGARLARETDVVTVSLNHRLGVLGYLHLGDLSDDFAAAGNAGNLDLVAGLEWVRDNIAAFGGDPSCVTVFGCSGGSCKIADLLAMPAARGLFHRAALESGPAPLAQTPEVAGDLAERLLYRLGIGTDEISRLQDVAVAELVAAGHDALGGVPLNSLAGHGLPFHGFAPVRDGDVLPDHPIDALAAGTAIDVPLLIGTNREEVLSFGWMLAGAEELPDDALRERMVPILGAHADGIVEVYRATRPAADSLELVVAIMTDCMFRVSSTRLAEARLAGGTAPVSMYEFGWASLDGAVRPLHTLEVPFVFGNVGEVPAAAADPGAEEMVRTMIDAWAAFARDGVPTTSALRDWKPYALDDRTVQRLDRDSQVENDLRGYERRAFDDVPIERLGSGRMSAVPVAARSSDSGPELGHGRG